jgi:hypothetical protein
MPTIQQSPAPPTALIYQYTSMPGAYTDSYHAEISKQVAFPEYVFAFYTTPLFKLERLILLLVRKPSTDAEAKDLANGIRDSFAAWTVEARAGDQILMCGFMNRTRSWLMIVPAKGGKSTQLYFGTAVVPKVNRKTGKSGLGFFFTALLGFHKVYSVLLLRSASTKLMRAG